MIVICFIVAFEFIFLLLYIYSGLDIMRLVGNKISPCLSFFSETNSGLEVVKSYKLEKKFSQKFSEKLSIAFKAGLFNAGALCWFGIREGLISLTLQITMLIFCHVYKDKYSKLEIGLILIYSTKISEDIAQDIYVIINSIDIMTSLERCVNFFKIPQEKLEGKILENFPLNGKIEFINYSTKYRSNLDEALKNINLTINPGEKIGIVGKSGSGKSTIALSISRILEAFKGKILIDGIDISTLNLEFLRKNITVIPQKPILFVGTLRDNIDSENLFSEEEIISAMKKLKLEKILKNGLDQLVLDQGRNFSLGEAQMICFTKALLKQSKIIIMDEVSASLDYDTDEFLQGVIRNNFKNSTILNIAHRPKMVMNSDKILVMVDGKVSQFNSPKNIKNIEEILV